ncbi:S1 RNA-binding domain-containing protein [Butyrivibrio sp.]|uniref:S1 RNA-binding domain-containing protein n=1 Tax=Butyrivibrio sp. TaxID=28121 RepID=UPI0025BAD54A|nr:S1 RNA-binding domain-containing protein [Butyrivibrio sp.]MBE5838444.1 S1 RNA-binding domain-containing protein [Butyrivibrio sp.]
MENLTCDICDGRLVVDKGGAVYCSQCGAVYTIAAMREKYQKMSNTGNVGADFTEKQSTQPFEDGASNVIRRATVLYELGDLDSAESICKQYLSQHPDDEMVRSAIDNYESFRRSVKTEGTILKGKVVSIEEFGVFVEFYKGCEGMVHISQLSTTKLNSCDEVCNIGDILWVKCKGLDKMGRLSYSAKDCAEKNGF